MDLNLKQIPVLDDTGLSEPGCGRESEVRGARRMQHNVFVSVSGKGEERRIVTERYGHDDPIDNLSQTRSRPLP